MQGLGTVTQDLTVKGESIERVYGIYNDRRYIVNRRYQRKLIWTLDEKIAFIDSILRGYPVPILLLAEDRRSGDNALEIIDGMQRLNAVMAFIENDYMVDGAFFDLNTMAVTKALLDKGLLEQTAERINTLFGVTPKRYEGFLVTGVEHEARALGKNLDQLFQTVVDRIRNSGLSPPLRDCLAQNIKLVRYYDLSVFVIEIQAQDDPSHYNGRYFVRHGAQLAEVPTGDLASFVRRYIGGT